VIPASLHVYAAAVPTILGLLFLIVGATGFSAEEFAKPRPPVTPSTPVWMVLIGGALILSVVAEIVAQALQ